MNTEPPKKLYRSRDDRMIAGVCGGLAKHFNIDSTWMRILFILLLLGFGSTLVVYIVMWLIVPEEPKEEPKQHDDNNVTHDPNQ